MGIRIVRRLLAMDTVTYDALNPEYLNIERDEILDYVKKHPYPDDPEYPLEDLIGDLTMSSGVYTLPDGVKQETIDYIEDMLNVLLR